VCVCVCFEIVHIVLMV